MMEALKTDKGADQQSSDVGAAAHPGRYIDADTGPEHASAVANGGHPQPDTGSAHAGTEAAQVDLQDKSAAAGAASKAAARQLGAAAYASRYARNHGYENEASDDDCDNDRPSV